MKRRAACATLGTWLGAGLVRSLEAEEAYGPDVRIKPLSHSTDVVVTCSLPDSPSLKMEDGPLDAAVGRRFLQMYLYDDVRRSPAPTPILGRYEVAGKQLRFIPRFALSNEAAYVAKATNPARPEQAVLSEPYRVPPAESAGHKATRVAGIYPNQTNMPANVLKFYVVFSAPMREGREVLEGIQLLEDGVPVAAPWRDLELWNEDRTRLSLYLHPGRIKRGVNLREEFGPLLHPGREYEIVVPATMRDAFGRAISESFRHRFRTTEELYEPIHVANWSIIAPPSDSQSLLRVVVDRDLDVYQVVRRLTVRDPEGKLVRGVPGYLSRDRRYVFLPESTWKPGKYSLEVDPRLEDLCGNTPLRAFDHELQSDSSTNDAGVSAARLRQSFTVR